MINTHLRLIWLASISCLPSVAQLHAGDAVMWNSKGNFYTAQYSSTPRGGKDYATGDQAAEEVARMMVKQGVTEANLIWKSDRTGYFTVWSGLDASNKMVAAVGFGSTEGEAKVDGLAAIRKAGAQSQFFIAHRYTSHGSDYVGGTPVLPDLDDSAVESEDISYFSPDGKFALSLSHSRGFKLRRLDLVDLQTFERVIEFAMPMALAGSVVWSADSQRLAFFGEERAYADTWVYKLQDGKWIRLSLPDRDTFPDPALDLKEGERILETKNDVLRPKSWASSRDLELERVLDVIVEKNYVKVAAVTAITSLTIHFESDDTTTITSVAQSKTRKEIEKPKKPADLPAKNPVAQPGAK